MRFSPESGSLLNHFFVFLSLIQSVAHNITQEILIPWLSLQSTHIGINTLSYGWLHNFRTDKMKFSYIPDSVP